MAKTYRLRPDQIKEVAPSRGACIASDKITVEGRPINFMYRQKTPDGPNDSGWRFLAGTESQEYMDESDNHGIYDVNTIVNYDPTIIPYLDAPPGSVFERTGRNVKFVPVSDWTPPDD